MRVGSRDGWGCGGVVGRKWRQLYLNNNKKCGKKDLMKDIAHAGDMWELRPRELIYQRMKVRSGWAWISLQCQFW